MGNLGACGRLLAAALGIGAPLAGAHAAELEISLYGGAQSVASSDIDSPASGNLSVDWEGRSGQLAPYYGVRATWWRNDRWGWGLEMNHAKAYADDPGDYGYDRLEFSDGLNFVTANIFRRWQQPGQSITPYVGVGLGVAIPHVDIEPVGGDHTFGFQVTGPVVQVVAGASHALNDRWSVFGEYKGTWSSHEVDLDSGGSLETDLVTNAVNIGISRKF